LAFKRPCDRCKKLFMPNSNSHRLCYECLYKVKKKIKDEKILKVGKNKKW